MPIYAVFIGDSFIKSFKDVSSAKFVKYTLNVFFDSEELPYKARIKYIKLEV